VAAPLEIAYHPPDAGSLAAGLALGAASARYTGCLLLNRSAPQPLPPGASAIARKREAGRTSTATLLTDVAAEDLRLAFGGAPAPLQPAQARPQDMSSSGVRVFTFYSLGGHWRSRSTREARRTATATSITDAAAKDLRLAYGDGCTSAPPLPAPVCPILSSPSCQGPACDRA